MTQGEIREVIENGETIHRDGQIEEIIGQVGGKTIIAGIVGGTLLLAEGLDRPVEHDPQESNCEGVDEHRVETDNDRGDEGNPEHTLRDEKPINDRGKLDQILRNPDRILEFGNRRYYLKAFEDGVALVLTHKNLKFDSVYELITQITDDGGTLYDDIDDAVEGAKEEEDGKEPTRNVDC